MFIPLALNIFHVDSDYKIARRMVWLFCAFLLSIFVLRDYSVGRDIPGYAEIYESAGMQQWFDYDWIYMEPGYVFLMKLCNTLGISFRLFLLILYSILVIPIGVYISKSSKDISLSLIIYVCFQFFVFNMSALRQSAAMGLCLIAFIVAHKNGKAAFLGYIILVIAAISIHKSAIVFLPAYFIMRQRLSPKMLLLYSVIAVFAIIKRTSVLQFFQDNQFTDYQFDQALTIGPSFFLTLVVLVFAAIRGLEQENETSFINISKNILAKPESITLGLSNYANLLACSILLLLAFSGTILMRASTFYQLSIIIIVPNIFASLECDTRRIFKFGFIIVMYAIFYYTVLLPNQFDIIPYIWGSDIALF